MLGCLNLTRSNYNFFGKDSSRLRERAAPFTLSHQQPLFHAGFASYLWLTLPEHAEVVATIDT